MKTLIPEVLEIGPREISQNNWLRNLLQSPTLMTKIVITVLQLVELGQTIAPKKKAVSLKKILQCPR